MTFTTMIIYPAAYIWNCFPKIVLQCITDPFISPSVTLRCLSQGEGVSGDGGIMVVYCVVFLVTGTLILGAFREEIF